MSLFYFGGDRPKTQSSNLKVENRTNDRNYVKAKWIRWLIMMLI